MIHQSVPYNFLYNLLTENCYTLEDLSTNLYVSPASVSRKLRALKKYLLDYGLRLRTTKVAIHGPEHTIRSMVYNLFWMIDRGAHLRQTVSLSSRLSHISLGTWQQNICREEIELFLAIAACRYEKQAFINPERFSHYPRPELPLPVKKFVTTHSTTEHHESELGFLDYFFVYRPGYFDPQDPRTTYLTEAYPDTEVDYLASRFLNSCEPYFKIQQLAADERKLLYINILNVFETYHLEKKAPPTMLDFLQESLQTNDLYHSQAEQIIHTQLAKIAQQARFSWIANCLTKLCTVCTYYLADHYDTTTTKKMTIFIENDPNQFLTNALFVFCRKLPFVDTKISTTLPLAEHDVIIRIKWFNRFELFFPKSNEHYLFNNLSADAPQIQQLLKQHYYELLTVDKKQNKTKRS